MHFRHCSCLLYELFLTAVFCQHPIVQIRSLVAKGVSVLSFLLIQTHPASKNNCVVEDNNQLGFTAETVLHDSRDL